MALSTGDESKDLFDTSFSDQLVQSPKKQSARKAAVCMIRTSGSNSKEDGDSEKEQFYHEPLKNAK